MSMPVIDNTTAIANLDTLIASVTSQINPDQATEAEQVALGTYLTQLVNAKNICVTMQAKYRKPFRVVKVHQH